MKSAKEVLSKYCGLNEETALGCAVLNAMREYANQFKPKSHDEAIRCPECGEIQIAKVKHTIPFDTFLHSCQKCGYVIMESEWNKI
jgi:predicted RNA-binding Zn-ribbon protein involved in translation (DUF1610 family)